MNDDPNTPPPRYTPIYTLPKRRRNRRAGIIGAVVVVCGVVLLAVAFAARGSAWSHPLSAETATPSPTATTDLVLLAHAYSDTVFNIDLGLREDMSATGKACGNVTASTTSTCKASIQTVENDLYSFQDELHSTPPPPYLHAVDTTLRHALALVQQGSQDALNGVND